MASISPTSLSCSGEPHTGHGAKLTLTITSITDSDASTNKRYIGWKITFGGTPWVKLYKAYCTLGSKTLYDSEPETEGWSVGTVLASDTTTFDNDSAGNLSLSAYLKQLFFYGTWAWDRSGYYQEASTTMTCSQLPRYANFKTHSASTGLNKVTISYSADANYKAQQYSLDGGSWTNCSAGSYSIGGFTPGTTHSIKTRIQRTDSGLWKESSSLSFKLKSLPSSNAISDVNFDSSGIRVDASITSKDYLSGWYISIYDGNTQVRDGSDYLNPGSSTTDYWMIRSAYASGMLPRHGSDNEWNLTARFYVVSNGTTYQLSNKTFKCKIPSNLYLPTYNVNNISYDVTDAKTLNLTNNNTKKVIKGVSNVQITSTAATPNGSSSMASYVATSGTKSNSTSNTTAPITINLTAVDGSSVVVQALDSRNRSTSATKQYDTFIDYFSPVIESASVNRIDGIGTNLSVNITGRYCNWSGLATNNTITQVSLKYRIKGDQNWTTISGVNLTMSVGNGNFTITGNITGNLFNAVNEYEVLLTFEDKIEEFSYQPTIPPGQAFIWRDMINKRLGINKKPNYTLDVDGYANFDNDVGICGSVDVDGNLTCDGTLKAGHIEVDVGRNIIYSGGTGYTVDYNGDWTHNRSTNTDKFVIKDHAGTVKLYYNYETGLLDLATMLTIGDVKLISTTQANDGYSIRFANGLQICFAYKSVSIACNSQWVYLFEGGSSVGNFPQSFKSGTTPFVYVSNTNPDGYVEGLHSPSNTAWGTLRMAIPTNATRTFKVMLFAIGFWK